MFAKLTSSDSGSIILVNMRNMIYAYPIKRENQVALRPAELVTPSRHNTTLYMVGSVQVHVQETFEEILKLDTSENWQKRP